ncbi:MAG TPA: ATP-binding cassette domain-containing protein, partial [Burkholderiales bacterium]|nr:ATP-binding cassette domain-containing protein [Burkholderiales bacterium]
EGEFFGLLGPNGSGKTTTVHMLSTLIRPRSGTARVAGLDVVAEAVAVRSRIGVVFQDSALDRTLSVWENLRFCGMLYGLAPGDIARRAGELLDLFGLAEKRDRPVATLSGGQRRALDIARGVIHRPEILFLDEPTIGLDLPNRRRIWRFIEQLRAEHGITVLLTTHYLEEAADCGRVAFISRGRIVTTGAPRELISSLADYMVEIEAADLDAADRVASAQLGAALRDGERLCYRFRGEDPSVLAALQARLGSGLLGLRWRRPNLNDVFMWVNEGGVWQEQPRAAAEGALK